MDKDSQQLFFRLSKAWETPDFAAFFTRFSKHPPHSIKKGAVLFNEGDTLEKLYFIKNGFVHLYRLSEEGKETTSYLFGPNHLLGVRSFTSFGKHARHSAQALTDLEVMTITHKEYFKQLVSYPQHLLDLMYIFMDRLNYTEQKLEGFIATDTTTRVANFLSGVVSRFCQALDGAFPKEPITLPLPLTHQLIAELIGSVRETVTLSIEKLEKEGILQTRRGTVTILDINKLNSYAQLHKKPK